MAILELITFAELKKVLDLQQAAIGDYPQLEVLKESVEQAISDYIYRDLNEKGLVVEQEYVGEVPTRYITLHRLPVESVSEVSVDGIVVDADRYRITDYGIQLKQAVRSVSVSVTYIGGLEVGDTKILPNLKRAAMLQIAYELQGVENIGAETISSDGGTITRPELGLLKEVRRILDRHTNPGYY